MEMADLIRVLVVEDDEAQAGVIKMLLKHNLGAAVVVAGNVAEARGLLASGDFELITLDFQLPDGDGLTLLEEIRARENPPPVIMVTGHGDEQTAVSAFKLGASGYVVKDKRLTTMLVEEARSALVKSSLARAEAALGESQSELEAVYAGIVDAVLVADFHTRRFVRANPAACQMFGYREDELLGLRVMDIHPVDALPRVLDLFEAMSSGELLEGPDLPCLKKDRSVFYASLRGRQITYRGRQCELAVFRDITERRRAEEALRESEERYREIFENATEGIFQSAPEGTHLSANPSLARMFGFESPEQMMEQVTDMAAMLYADPGDRDEVKRLLEDRGHIEAHVVRGKRPDGEPLWFSLNAHTVKDDSGKVLYFEGTIEDVTKQRLTEDELRSSVATFSGLASAAADGILLVGSSGTLTYMNAAAERIFGYAADEVLGKQAVQLLAPPEKLAEYEGYIEDFQKRDRGLVVDASDHGQPKSSEFLATRKDGTLITVEISGSSMQEEDRNVALVLARDVTDRRRAQEALEASERMFRRLSENTSAGIIIYQGTKFVFVNEAAAAMAGYTPDELLAMNFWDVAEPSFRDVVKERGLARQRGDPVPPRYEFPFVTKSGEHRVADFSAVEIEYQGEPAGIATLIDISHLKEAEVALRAANDELQGFAHTVSHDLRGPMASATAALEVILATLDEAGEAVDAAALREVAKGALKSIVKSSELMSDLLVLAIVGRERDDAVEVDVGAVVGEVLDDEQASIGAQGGSLEFDKDLGTLLANRTHVYQLFANLIRNGFQHAETSAPVVQVRYLGSDDNGAHRYLVRDNGSGIAGDMMDSLFEPFSKGETGGTGVGLAIVAKIVATYGGEIKAYNDEGACFEFSLRDAE